jgi:peptidyl-prolyl cis-trans isomerase SurA
MTRSLSKMMHRNVGLAAAALLALSASARAELVDRVAAVVNEEIIPLTEVEQRAAPDLARIATEPDAQKRTQHRQQALKAAVEALIGERLLDSQIRELNVDVTDAEVEAAIDDVKKQNNVTDEAQFEQMLRAAPEAYTLTSYRAFMKKHIAKLKLINLKVRSKVKISDDDLKAEYARWSRMEAEDPEVHARHILVQVGPRAPTEEQERAHQKALELATEARQPGVDFVELAKKKSEGPSAPDGGDLGFFKRGVMVPEFEKVAFTLKTGEVSEPVRTKFGWHVIKVEERRAGQVKSYDEMKDQLRDKLTRTQLEKYTDHYVQELRDAAVVEVKI